MTFSDSTDTLPPAYEGRGQTPFQNLDLRVIAQPSTHEVLISLVPPTTPAPQGEKQDASGKRAPVDLCLVLDVSGSMSALAPAPGEQESESTGLTVLDVVKHATRTIVESLDDNDRVSIVAFSHSAAVITPLTLMTERNKKDTWNKVSGLATGGNTNLWDGLKTGLNVLTGREKPRDTSETNTQQRLHALFLLTDGQPNVEPPRGHLPSLEAYLDAIPANTPRPSIHTFGFGYELDSSLLDALAHRGGGMYGFMPDSGMVGTVFVHAVANVACAWAASCQVSVEIQPEQQDGVQVVGAFPVVNASWGAQIQVGDILYGQSRDLIVRLPSDCFGPKATSRATVTAHYRPYWLAADAQPLIATASVNPNIERENSVDLRYNVLRLSFVRAVKDLIAASSSRAMPDAAKAVFLSSLMQLQADPALASYAPAAALRTDIASEVVMAVESANWKRWGYHYLPSLARSHLRQQCTNFKDPGLQVYGAQSALFLATRNTLSEKFDTLPPPTPSRRTVHSTPLHTMSLWQSASGPCFAGTCEVVLGDGKRVRVEELRAEMQVRTPNGPRTVVGLLRTACAGGMTELVELDGLLVTPWHPVLCDEGVWAFPASLGAVTRRPCEAVYSILLQRDEDPEAHAVCVGGVWCVTLGHGAVEGVRKHAFLGDWDKVGKAMGALGVYEGLGGVVACGEVVRDAQTGEICGFVPVQAESEAHLGEWKMPRMVQVTA